MRDTTGYLSNTTTEDGRQWVRLGIAFRVHPNVDPSDCECSEERGAKCLPCQFAATRELGFLDGLEAARYTASACIDDPKQRPCADQIDRDMRDGGIAVLEGLRESLIGAPARIEDDE